MVFWVDLILETEKEDQWKIFIGFQVCLKWSKFEFWLKISTNFDVSGGRNIGSVRFMPRFGVFHVSGRKLVMHILFRERLECLGF